MYIVVICNSYRYSRFWLGQEKIISSRKLIQEKKCKIEFTNNL